MHPRLVALGNAPPGTCRLCLVDTGHGRLQPACATALIDGMDVQTDTDDVRSNIQSVLSLLRANHPNDCMTCESNGRCEVWKLLSAAGVSVVCENCLITPSAQHIQFQDLLLRYKVGDKLPKLQDYSKVSSTYDHKILLYM